MSIIKKIINVATKFTIGSPPRIKPGLVSKAIKTLLKNEGINTVDGILVDILDKGLKAVSPESLIKKYLKKKGIKITSPEKAIKNVLKKYGLTRKNVGNILKLNIYKSGTELKDEIVLKSRTALLTNKITREYLEKTRLEVHDESVIKMSLNQYQLDNLSNRKLLERLDFLDSVLVRQGWKEGDDLIDDVEKIAEENAFEKYMDDNDVQYYGSDNDDVAYEYTTYNQKVNNWEEWKKDRT